MKRVALFAIVMLALLFLIASIAFSDVLIIKVVNQKGNDYSVTLLDYLDSGLTLWAIGAGGDTPAIYAGYAFSAPYGISGEIVPGIQLDRTTGLKATDYLIDLDFYWSKKSLSVSSVNELSGFYGTLWFWSQQQAIVKNKKFVFGLRGESFNSDSLKLGPLVGRQYGPVELTFWPWRDLSEWSKYGLTIQAKATVKY